jgi:hypothetical protein
MNQILNAAAQLRHADKFQAPGKLSIGGHLEVSCTTWPTVEIKMQVRLQELPILQENKTFVSLTMKPRFPLITYSEICFKLRMRAPVVIGATKHTNIEKDFEAKKYPNFGDHQRSVDLSFSQEKERAKASDFLSHLEMLCLGGSGPKQIDSGTHITLGSFLFRQCWLQLGALASRRGRGTINIEFKRLQCVQ